MKAYATLIILMLLAVFLIAGCAPTVGVRSASPDEDSDKAGFWKGLWHGFIVLFTFIVSLFKDSVGIYESHNSGNLYNLGFVLGVMIFFGGSSGGACKTKSK
jgi:hypothetical protein